jgi:hypothetical protein
MARPNRYLGFWAVLLGSGGWEDLGAWGRRRVNAGEESRGGAQGNSPEKV